MYTAIDARRRRTVRTPSIWAEISESALRENFAVVQRAAAPAAVMAVIKANAYGHGLIPCAQVFATAGADYLGVARLDEALELRRAEIETPILVLGLMRPEEAVTAADFDVAAIAADTDFLAAVAPRLARQRKRLTVHLKIDTGMGRVGVLPERALELARHIRRYPVFRYHGLSTHFASSDEESLDATCQQLNQYRAVVARFSRLGLLPHYLHTANSAAALRLPRDHGNLVRCGLALYGLYASAQVPRKWPLRPAMRLLARIVSIKDVPAGHPIGYGHTFHTVRPSRLAIIPVGYADGYDRALSNQAVMTARHRPAPVIGRVSMDQTVIDVTGIPGVRIGDEVVIYDSRADATNCVESIARTLDRLPYEITCAVGLRVERKLVD